jgi:hypothetical protein
MARWDSLAKRDELHGLNRHGQRLSDDDMRESPYCIERPHTGFRWNDGDCETVEWYPQAIAGITNADQSKKFLLVSWYHQNRYELRDKLGFKGVRVSLVDVTDMDDIWYRHVLLVERDGASIKPLTNAAGHSIHAGGIAVLGTTLYVADSANSQIRSFDLSRLVAAAPDTGKSRCEKTADGTYYAYDYRYLMIQQAARSVTPALLSFMSMDWSNPTSPSLLTGGFYYPDKGYDTSPSVRWWRPEDIVNATTARSRASARPPASPGPSRTASSERRRRAPRASATGSGSAEATAKETRAGSRSSTSRTRALRSRWARPRGPSALKASSPRRPPTTSGAARSSRRSGSSSR